MRVLGIFVVAASWWAVACGSSSDADSPTPNAGVGGFTPQLNGPQGGTVANPGPVTGPSGGVPSNPPSAGGIGQTLPPPGSGSSGGGGAPGAGGDLGAGGTSVTPVDPPGTVTLQVQSFDLAPGQETFKCQNFDNPFGGQDTAIQRVVTDMSSGSHHLHVYNLTEGTSRTLEDCDPNDFHALIHAAGRPHQETVYPAGMATKVRGTKGFRIQLHYINTTTQVNTVSATVKLSPVDPTTVTKWVAQLYFNRVVLSVPPGAAQTVQTTCSIPSAYGAIALIGGGSHMHRRGVHFVAATNTGANLIDTTDWDEPPLVSYDPPVMMNPADSITWTCTYNNDTGQTLTFGPSALTNEMCIYLARYYTSDANDVQIECQSPSPNGGTARLNPN